jgi:hypothetical protein
MMAVSKDEDTSTGVCVAFNTSGGETAVSCSSLDHGSRAEAPSAPSEPRVWPGFQQVKGLARLISWSLTSL